MTENIAIEVPVVSTPPLAPRGLPKEAVDVLLRTAHTEKSPVKRLRNETILALLIYGGLRVQEVCDVQLRDLDLGAGTLTVRSGKAGKARRIPLHPDAQGILRRYLDKVRCPNGMPLIGTAEESEPLLVRLKVNVAGQPFAPGVTQQVAQRILRQLGKQAAANLNEEAVQEASLTRSEQLKTLAHRLENVTPHQLRHSLAQRMIKSGAQLSEVQRILGHSRLSTTGIYLTPSEDDLRDAINRAGL
ncbi:MAG TPA: tyrosine-type recombinase/integrase [Ktedonobacteraceae bacterium]|nr:tyrosine-type recombinase/integrase [Ktedonobacteraceae bacterium]